MRLLQSLAFVLAACVALPAAAIPYPVQINVTSSADSGPGTLRAAIIAGNAISGDGFPEINVLLDSNHPIVLMSPLPVITKPIMIYGEHDTPAVISGDGHYPVLNVDTSSAQTGVWLTNLVLREGVAQFGGCLRVQSRAMITIADTRFEDCLARSSTGPAQGGAIHAVGGSLTLGNSRFIDNTAHGKNATGGAIHLPGDTGISDKLTIRHSLFRGNTAVAWGENSSRSDAGAISVYSVGLTIEDSLFHDNAVLTDYDSSWGNYAGAVQASYSLVDIRRTTFSLNRGRSTGALYISGGLDEDTHKGVTLINNTFVGNLSTTSAAAINIVQADTVLRNNSFFANDCSGTNCSNNLGVGKLMYGAYPAYEFWHNIFSNDFPGPSCQLSWALGHTQAGYNVMNDTSCGALDNSQGSVVMADLHLQGYLLRNKLPAAPLRPFADSPAVDGGNPVPPNDTGPAPCPTIDGQSNPRVADGDADGAQRCDIGAFEWQHEASLFAADFEKRLWP